ncbi:hypothetical protein BU197_17165 [Streptomyces sp. CBMA291]|nr:hypothetical protein [Streptomyces sp. CBMA291]MBD0715662.1 hypothetical protein [Streptomyces sp. CBMA370]
MKPQWAVLSGAAAVLVAAAATVITRSAQDAPPAAVPPPAASPAAAVTRIAFDEAAMMDPARPGTTHRRIEMYAEHRGEAVTSLRFLITTTGKLTEERLWEAARPETITVRDWTSCRTADERVPDPRPDRLDVITTELFGPAAVPGEAKAGPGGTRQWTTSAGLITSTFTDGGGPYPDRTVRIAGPDGQVGSVIDHTLVGPATALPGWHQDWKNCAPPVTR